MNKTRHYIRTLLLVLLFGGMASEAWATSTTVTYHIITRPFGFEKRGVNITGSEYRIEAMKCEVDCDTEDLIELPAKYKSPLLTDNAYKYYKSITKSSLMQIFKNNGSKYYTYSDPTNEITSEKVGETKDIYVLYEWDEKTKSELGKKLDIDGNKVYNIEFKDYLNKNSWFFATNMDQGRGNRAQTIPVGDVNDYLDLSTKGPHEIKNANISRKNFDFMWKLVNNDPYNIILETAYSGPFIYVEECYSKKIDEARVYGILKDGKPSNYWMTNEWRYAWPVKNTSNSEAIIPLEPGSPKETPGWFRNHGTFTPDNWGVKINGVPSGLYFSFSLLNRTAAEGDYTLIASWADVDGKEWVPNSSKQYLHLGHYTTQGVTKDYPGPSFSTFERADKVIFHEVRNYTFKVKTPLSKTILEAPLKWSDYAKDTRLIDRVPDALKRKYTEFTDAYANEGLTAARTTFASVYTDDEADVNKNRDIWLKYAVSESIPFKAAPDFKTSFDQLKWYNIYLNKEEKYTAWYDTDDNKFNTQEGTSGHTKYRHESHFAFIGDPYELYVVNRQASEDYHASNPSDNQYLKLDATTTSSSLVTGTFNEFNAVPNGTTLIAGKTYYTSSNGGGMFIATGNEESGTFYERKFNLVTDGATLTNGTYYYTSSAGGGGFTAGTTQEAASGSQYFVKEFFEITNGRTLTPGKAYYTSSSGDGCFIATGSEVMSGKHYFDVKYTAVLQGTTLTAGSLYYQSSTGENPLIASYTGVANGSNFFTKEYATVTVGGETKLTAGDIYYTSDTDQLHTAAGNETATGDNYYDKANVWEIIFDSNTGDYAGCFRLRKFNTYDNPVTIGWGASDERPLNGDGGNGSNITKVARLSVLELPMMYYTYYIVDSSKRIAVKATEEQITGTTLNYEAIPEIIRSPFLKELKDDVKLRFYSYKSDDLHALTGMTVDLTTTDFEEIYTANSEEGSENEYKKHIFVSYEPTKLSALDANPLDNNPEHKFYVLLNNEYIYYDGSSDKINSSPAIPSDNGLLPYYQWVLGGGDPYALTIRNLGANEYVTISDGTDADTDPDWADGTISWSVAAPSSRYIIKSSTLEKTYEVMAATGVALDANNKIDATNSIDASTLYYNIGRTKNNTTNAVEVKVYSNATYETGYAQLRFELEPIEAHEVTYHLIDKFNKDLLQVKARQAGEEAPRFPSQYWSPLVDKYYYYLKDNFDVTAGEDKIENTADDIFILKNNQTELSTIKISADKYATDIYVIYDVNNKVDMNHTTMYLLKFAMGDDFRQEDGSDDMLPAVKSEDIDKMTAEQKEAYYDKYRAVYPYCNGDANFNVYGQHQYDLQQEGAASTRTRWAWYVQSTTHDPYHVMILSRQTETYKGLERSAYFATRKVEGYDEVVTALVWPNISGVMATEYMVLGSEHQYQLVTTKPLETKDLNKNGKIDDVTEEVRYTVDSFEQYWKTYDLIRRKLLKDNTAANPADPADVPDEPSFVTGFTSNRTFLTTDTEHGGMGWHAYNKMAKAKRWNGYNKEGETSKGWESREHWFQTVKMGSGYFDLIPVEIAPALILLDQHGWEIMRKPLPTSPDDPNKEHKYDVLRQYDSPMVKEYLFWASAKKRSGYHQYYSLDKRIGGDFTSTSLTSLPPYDSENVHDAKGNQYDQYVTYIVKDEYAQSYLPGATPTAVPFLIRQGNKLAVKATSGTTIGTTPVDGTPGVAKYIIDKSGTTGLINELWYVMPNASIDREMGYPAVHPDWKGNPNAYEETTYSTLRTADLVVNTTAYQSLLTDEDKNAFIAKYGYFTFSNGFDPYNIQISSQYGGQYFTLGMTSSYVEEGEIKGDYKNGSQNVTQAVKNTTTVAGNSYDNAKFAMTNQTFMAVQDAEGNMQLMPRFDHSLRVRDFRILATPDAEAAEPDKLFETQTQLYRPFVYNYRIIDNEGREALRYKWAGELVPQMPEHLKSPLATNFKYYRLATYNDVTKRYIITESTDAETSPYEITAMSSMAGAGLSTSGTMSNFVYIRYTYNEEADKDHILQGKWLTMRLNGMDAQYDDGIKAGTKPATSEDLKLVENYNWHWKFLKNSYSAPDPYAVQLFNRSRTVTTDGVKVGLPMSANTIGDPVSASSSNTYQHFVLLLHTDASGNADGYALAVARTLSDTSYPFLNGRSMSTSTAAKMEEDKDYAVANSESSFTSTTGTFHADDSRIQLTDDVTMDITYHVYTNGNKGLNAVKYGVEAISEMQPFQDISDNEFVAILPDDIRSPLLPQDWFLYYEAQSDMGNPNREIKYLYGLYDNDVYVRYKLYDPGHTDYKVPNARNEIPGDIPGGFTVARDPQKSNDSSLGLDGKLPYNIIWYDDNMMKSEWDDTDGYSVKGDANQPLQHEGKYEWRFEGDDPYAIKLKSVGASTESAPKYIDASNDLTADAQTFMLLPKSGYEYGVLAKTGDKNQMLSLKSDRSALEITNNPQSFIIFTLATLRVVYHLVIANIKQADGVTDGYETIAWRDPAARGTLYTWLDDEKGYDTEYDSSTNTKNIKGTSMRDLSDPNSRIGVPETYNDETLYYCYDAGRISLGDTLKVPNVFYRPNVVYTFFVRDIIDTDDVGDNETTKMNNQYKGMEITSKRMGLDLDLIGKTIYINIVYSFNGDLDSNSGDNFVLGLDENKWYTLETVVKNKTYLAQYTNAWGFELKEGRGSHYTNDFLWSPIGDPYGFQLFNRYMDVNSGDHNLGEKDRVITTIPFKTKIPKTNPVTDEVASAFEDGKQIVMGNYKEAGLRVVVPGGKARTSTTLSPGDTGYDSDNHVKLSDIKTNSIYELLDAKTPGYFRIHPVANYQPTDSVFFHPVEADDDGDGTKNFLIRLSKNVDTEFTFGLSKELLKPYFDRAGYVGGLQKTVYDKLVKNDYSQTVNVGGVVQENGYYNLAKVMLDSTAVASAAQLRTAQTLVYDTKNIVPFATGYYRLHSPLGISGIDPARYASGYTHKTELDVDNNANHDEDHDGNNNDAIPMHFYEKNSDEVRQFTDFKDGGFTSSPATQGDLTIPPVERDPASIFYFERVADSEIPVDVGEADRDRYNLGTISTQDLYIKGQKGKVTISGTPPTATQNENIEAPGERPAAVMTETKSNATKLFVMDLGGGVLLIHDNVTALGRQYLKYLSYDYSRDKESGTNTIYNLKLTNHTHTDHAKWCMQPVQSEAKKGINEMGLRFAASDYTLNNGGDGYYYTTFYAPFDVLLTDDKNDAAYICEVWDTKMLHLRKVGRYNNTANNPSLDKKYQGNNQFVPANTPVVIRTKNTSVTMALPTNAPSPSLTENLKIVIDGKVLRKDNVDVTVNNIFKGVCLEQILTHGADEVFVFGLPFESPTVVTKDGAYASNGKYTVAYPTSADTGVGFYINVNYNREVGGSAGEWLRNNKCVYSNKIYIRPGYVSPSSARQGNMEYELGFVPVVFDDDEEEEDEPIGESLLQRPHDNRVYDLLGRCVASGEEVANGTWRSKVASGIYILNGRKIYVK